MKIAAAIDETGIAETLRKAEYFLTVSPDGTTGKLVRGKIPLVKFLQENGIDVFLCGKLGNCMAVELGNAGIQLIPGLSGPAEEAVKKFLQGTLRPGSGWSCSENGMTCGACDGGFR